MRIAYEFALRLERLERLPEESQRYMLGALDRLLEHFGRVNGIEEAPFAPPPRRGSAKVI